MAILIPSLGFARFDTHGELRLAERLKDFLEENAVVWHNLPVGPRSRHPDFIIVHPANGLLVLEVKDWRFESIASADKTKVELLTSRGTVWESSPLEQARKYTFEVVRTLERDGQLLFPAGHRFKGRPILPFGFGAVFTNITRKQFDQTNLKEVLAEHLCVFKDEMTEGTDPEEFRSRLWRMVYTRVGEPLSMPQFDRLRALLFPEIRIRQIALPLDEPMAPDPSDRTLAVMDLHQEQMARSLGEGHRIIRGVAGSGKTLILAFRADIWRMRRRSRCSSCATPMASPGGLKIRCRVVASRIAFRFAPFIHGVTGCFGPMGFPPHPSESIPTTKNGWLPAFRRS